MQPDRPPIALLLRRAQQDLQDAIHGALSDAGFADIRAPHASVFPFVPEEGIRVGELARHAGVRKQSMAQAVEQLVALGYVERRPDATDGRARLVVLTARGRAVRPVARAAGRRVEERWAQLTSEAHVEALRTALTGLVAAIREADDPRAGG